MKGFDLENVFFYKNGTAFGKIKRVVVEGGHVWFFNKLGLVAEADDLTDRVFIRCTDKNIWESCNYLCFGKLYYTFSYDNSLLFVPSSKAYNSTFGEKYGQLDSFMEISLESYANAVIN